MYPKIFITTSKRGIYLGIGAVIQSNNCAESLVSMSNGVNETKAINKKSPVALNLAKGYVLPRTADFGGGSIIFVIFSNLFLQ